MIVESFLTMHSQIQNKANNDTQKTNIDFNGRKKSGLFCKK